MEQKFAPLSKLIPDTTATRCEVEFEKTAEHQHGRIYRIEANVSVRGKLYRAEATEHTFEEALDKVRDELDSELTRAKDKKDTLHKRAGRALKRLLTRG